jgi:release factor glutamine methyltransferase
MAVNLQTIKEIRNFLVGELNYIYSPQEVKSIISIVLKHVLKRDNLHLLAINDQPVSRKEAAEIRNISNKLRSGEPIQYVLGETDFYRCRIKVNPHVLIPRPETEELVDLIIKENPGFSGKILDIGTGSGCIAVALGVNMPFSQISAIDNSREAIATAIVNAKINNVNIRFFNADITTVPALDTGKAGIIVSNPPYVLDSEKAAMNRNILDFEPPAALFVPDDDPLKFYRSILDYAVNMLTAGGKIYFEINEAQGASAADLITSYSYSGVTVIKDMNNKDRFIKGIKK